MALKPTHPVNFPCGRKPEYPEKTHDFRQSVDKRAFACDVMAAMLVYLDKRILKYSFERYTNVAVNFFVVLIPRD